MWWEGNVLWLGGGAGCVGGGWVGAVAGVSFCRIRLWSSCIALLHFVTAVLCLCFLRSCVFSLVGLSIVSLSSADNSLHRRFIALVVFFLHHWLDHLFMIDLLVSFHLYVIPFSLCVLGMLFVSSFVLWLFRSLVLSLPSLFLSFFFLFGCF